jgi:hypothetical protein
MKNIFLLLCVFTSFACEAPRIKHTPLVKEIASFARHIQSDKKTKGPCDHLWVEFEKERQTNGSLSDSAEKVWHEFMACVQTSIKESSNQLKKTQEQIDAISRFKEKTF